MIGPSGQRSRGGGGTLEEGDDVVSIALGNTWMLRWDIRVIYVVNLCYGVDDPSPI